MRSMLKLLNNSLQSVVLKNRKEIEEYPMTGNNEFEITDYSTRLYVCLTVILNFF